MSPINRNGLLGKEVIKLIEKTHNDHKDYFVYANKLNVLIHDILNQLSIVPIDGNEYIKELIFRTCFLRSLNIYNCIIVLIERNMTSQAGVLLRSLIELKNLLSACINREGFIDEYIKANELQDVKNNKGVLKTQLAKEIVSSDVEEKLNELQKEIEKRQNDHVSVEKVANYANFSDEYKLAYNELSQYVHHSLIGLIKDHAVFDENEDIKSFQYFPRPEKFDSFFSHTLAAMLFISDIINMEFSLGFKNNISELDKEFNARFIHQNNKDKIHT